MGVRIIYEDTLNQDGKHELKHEWFAAHGIEVRRVRFDGKHGVPWSFGDYGVDGANVVVDTKNGLGEISSNLGRDHSRFKREVQRANTDGCLLVVLIETTEVKTIDDVLIWINSHCRHCSHFYGKRCDPRNRDEICIKHGTKKPLQGETVAKQMTTMQINRGVRFEFVKPEESAKRICELLGVMYETDSR